MSTNPSSLSVEDFSVIPPSRQPPQEGWNPDEGSHDRVFGTPVERTDVEGGLPSAEDYVYGKLAGLLEAIAPDVPAVSAAAAPILAEYGLSVETAHYWDDVLAIPGLAERVMDAALVAMGEEPDGAQLLQRDTGNIVLGGSGAGFQIGPDGPCYPDVPGMEDRVPKCPEDEEEQQVQAEPFDPMECLSDDRFLNALDHIENNPDYLDRLPTNYRGEDYRTFISNSLSLQPIERYYRCTQSTKDYASWSGVEFIKIGPEFLSLDALGSLGGLFTYANYRHFRAGIIVHEHLHRVQDLETLPHPDIVYHPLGAARRECQGGEYDGWYMQGLYYWATPPMAVVFGNIYARSRPCPKGSGFEYTLGAQAIAAVGDFFDAVTATELLLLPSILAFSVTVRKHPDEAAQIISSFVGLPPEQIALFLTPFL